MENLLAGLFVKVKKKVSKVKAFKCIEILKYEIGMETKYKFNPKVLPTNV